MSKPAISILISSYERLPLLRRTLWSISARPPQMDYEVIVVDDGSQADILGALRAYDSVFPWKLIRFSSEQFEKETGVAKFFNNPSATNNVAFRHASGDFLFQQGNEVIAWGGVYDKLLEELPKRTHALALSMTLDVPQAILEVLDAYGTNLTREMVLECVKWPLASPNLHTDVTNYISVATRHLWESLGGYDERYVGGIGKEDSDFIRRCRALPDWTDSECLQRSNALSLHQFHGGRTHFYLPAADIITAERWKEGEERSKSVWDSWDGSPQNKQPWPWGEVGVVEVISNT